ncbi:MAG: FAD:protein FMN transferase [Oscillospiraceae bacterium]|nr:FAD:protein FMN transferase [Candidatus Ruminococcus equi]
MKKLLSAIIIVVIALSFVSCKNSDTPCTDEMYALDTLITFKVYGDEQKAQNATDKAKKEIQRLEELFSVNKDGDVKKINESEDFVAVSDETMFLLNTAQNVSKDTDGAFDITIYPIMKLWGFTDKNYKVPTDEKIKETLQFVDYKKVALDDKKVKCEKGVYIDLGAIAKGYIGDKVAKIFEDENLSAIIDLGGNIVLVGKKPDGTDYKVGITCPEAVGDYFCTVDMKYKSAVTSGAYQRFFEENGKLYHHIMNPKTGKPSQSDISSVTVFSNDTALADAYSTSIFVMGIDKSKEFLKNKKDIAVAILDSEKKKLYVSEDIAKDITLQQNYKDIEIATI